MSVETLISLWKDARTGLTHEVERIPEDQISFRATPETRCIAEILQHIVQTQKVLVGELCRPDTDLSRQSFAAHYQEYAPGVEKIVDKQGLLELLSASMDEAASKLSAYGEKLDEPMTSFDGRETSKISFLTFVMSHEMYHRGQLTVYERLMNVEPALTVRLKKLFATA